MASPQATEPTDVERDELQRDLETLRGELRDAIEGSEQDARPVELDQPAVGRVSRIDAIQQQKMLEANRNAQRARLAQVHAALDRFAEDEYGDCVACGETIGFARLKARPESLYCIACQSAREKR
ncbi:MAG: TraR/DksA family transcriptional regulator [Myxococcota bacterium]|jgi:DnaK suppressor protein|nr:TraR/DksA family transcriptional regulator [Myxococcota bacterium]